MAQIADLRMWGDEGFSVYSANRDLYAITFEGKEIDPHPPLYYYLFHFWLPRAGFSELSLRFFSVLFGTATIALIYAIGKRMFDARVGALAAALAALAPFAVHYSQEVRMYALVMFLGAVALWFFARLVITSEAKQSPGNLGIASSPPSTPLRSAQDAPRNDKGLWLGFFAAMLLTQYALYQAAFIFVAQGVFLLPLLKRRFAFVLRWFAVSCAVVALFLPWLLTHSGSAFADVKDVAGDTLPMNLPTFLARGFAAIAVGTTIPWSNAFALAALFAGVIVVGLAIALVTRQARVNDWLLVAFVVVPMVSLYPIYFLAPLYRGRLFALAFVPLMLLLARSALVIVQRARLAAIPIALLIVGASAYSLNSYYFDYNRYSAAVEDYLPLIHAIEQRAQPGDVVLFHAYWQQGYFLSHYHGAPLEYRALDNQNDVAAAVSPVRNVWAIVQALPHHDAETWLAQNAFLLGEEKFGQMRLLSYRAGTPARGETFATPVVFGDGIALLGYHLNDTPIESGRGSVTIQLDWQAAQKIADDYVVSVRVTNPRGDVVWAQADAQPASGTLPTSAWQPGQRVRDDHALLMPAGVPPGEYAIRIVLYDSKSGSAAHIVAPDNRRGQALALGKVLVVKPGKRAIPTLPNVFDARWNEIALVGFAGVPDEIAAGDSLPLTLYWQAQAKPTRDYRVHVLVFDSAGGGRASDIHRPANAAFPTHAWDAGDIWLDKFRVTIAAEAVAGEASVFVFVTDEQSDETIPLQTTAATRDLTIKGIVAPGNMLAHAVRLATVKMTTRAHRFDLPSPQFPVQATLGDSIQLLGYDLAAVKPGTPLRLTLYWQLAGRIDERYTVFAHLLDASGAIVAQRDGEPGAGAAPTTSWVYGEVIADPYLLDLPPNLAPGEYTLVVGMYRADTGVRLVVGETGADRVPLAKIESAAR